MMMVVVVVLFLIGVFSTVSLCVYTFSLLSYLSGGEGAFVGIVASIPKWIFIPSPLIYLVRRREVKSFIYRLEEFFNNSS